MVDVDEDSRIYALPETQVGARACELLCLCTALVYVECSWRAGVSVCGQHASEIQPNTPHRNSKHTTPLQVVLLPPPSEAQKMKFQRGMCVLWVCVRVCVCVCVRQWRRW